jgi:glycerophosphoryl diester phosphodiesterase
MLIKQNIIKLLLILNILINGCNNFIVTKVSSNLEQNLKAFHNPNSEIILVAAHRAQHTKFPENSLAAIQHSIDNGVDIIEIDVRSTKDGKLVLLHDSKINRTTNGKGELANLTFNETQKYSLVNSDSLIENHKIPLLEDALEIAKDKIMIDIDIKGVPVKELLKVVNSTDTKSQVIFFDSEFEVLDSLLLLDSTLTIMPRAYSLDDVNIIIEKYNPKVIHVDDSFFTKEVESIIKNNNSRIWINALGKPDQQANENNFDGYTNLMNSGANIIQTDLPVILKNYLEKNKSSKLRLN